MGRDANFKHPKKKPILDKKIKIDSDFNQSRKCYNFFPEVPQ